jgi:hypothetical protein
MLLIGFRQRHHLVILLWRTPRAAWFIRKRSVETRSTRLISPLISGSLDSIPAI